MESKLEDMCRLFSGGKLEDELHSYLKRSERRFSGAHGQLVLFSSRCAVDAVPQQLMWLESPPEGETIFVYRDNRIYLRCKGGKYLACQMSYANGDGEDWRVIERDFRIVHEHEFFCYDADYFMTTIVGEKAIVKWLDYLVSHGCMARKKQHAFYAEAVQKLGYTS